MVVLHRSIFVLFLMTWTLFACPIGEVIPNTAQVSYKMDNKWQIALSNEANYIKAEHTVDYQLEFFRYSVVGDTYLNISHTTYSTDGRGVGTFNPMLPLKLSTGEALKPTAKLALLATEVFSKYDPIILVLKDARANRSPSVRESVKVSIDNGREDHEVIELFESELDSSIFVGYINPTTDASKATLCDGLIYAYDHAKITAKPITSSYKSRGISHVRLQKSLTITPSISTLSALESKNQKKVWIAHKSIKNSVSLGDLVKFEVEIGNVNTTEVNAFEALVKLPFGLKYKESSFKVQDGVATLDSALFDENILKVKVANVGKELVKFSYVATVGQIAKSFEINAWCLQEERLISNLTKQTLAYQKEHLANSGFIFGQIKADKEIPLQNIRIYTDNGTYVLTDSNGKFHLEGLSQSLHVIQLDDESIDPRYKVKGEKTQFVDLSFGGVKRVTYNLEPTKDKSPKNSSQNPSIKTFVKRAKKTEKMPLYSSSDLRKNGNKQKFLWPPKDFNPSTPSVKVAMLYKKGENLKLFVNGKETNPLNFDKTISARKANMQIATYRGLDLKRGDNTLEAKLFSKQGKLVEHITHNVHFSSSAVRAEVLEKESYLIADGKRPVVIAVKLYDKQGYPVAQDSRGVVNVEVPYILQSSLKDLKANPLSNNAKNNYYVVYGDGIAYITLAPTTKSGEAVLHFNFNNRDTILRTWIKPKNRDWIIVGFAEGSVGYKKIKKNIESTKSKYERYEKGKVSLFAKGRIKGDVLVTMAYDSAKAKDTPLLDQVDPNQYYMIYQDGSTQDYEAQSQEKLYLKIEKEEFYALFGDFDTGLEVNELSRYRRVLNGVKSEYNGEMLSYKAFASSSKQLFIKDEIRADGTSGVYRLRHKDIITQSEKVVIEIRDRYREEKIISSKRLNRFVDYSIDYGAGTLYFKEPLFTTDESGNPRYIVVDYEMESEGNSNFLYGGRLAAKFEKKGLEVGTTYIKEDLGKNSKSLQGLDTKIRFNNQFSMKAEYAQTDHMINNQAIKGDAYLIEAFFQGKLLKTTAYFRNQNDAFGLDQQSKVLRHSQKMGIDGRLDYFKNVAVLFSAYSDKDLLQDTKTDVGEVMVELHNGFVKTGVGYRHSNDKGAKNSQLIANAQKVFLDNKLKARITYEHALDDPTIAYPTRSQLELRYALKSYTDLFVRSELSKYSGTQILNNSVGVSSRLWKGGEVESSVTDGYENYTKNIYSMLGI
ncbi:MAG: hypothetical protein K0U47_05905 [Epsilonproteobacteria bacterium]|nr:hypothetical protein [Campylobacterota bacterium]